MRRMAVGLLLCSVLFAAAGCAAGDVRFQDGQAGFWAGLWHGLICFVTFIISLFYDSVRVYEVRNAGHMYDLGFILGAMIAFGGSGGSGICRTRRKWREKDWDEIGDRVDEKVRKSVQACLDEAGKKDPEWEELGKKIEDKIKREIRNWAEK